MGRDLLTYATAAEKVCTWQVLFTQIIICNEQGDSKKAGSVWSGILGGGGACLFTTILLVPPYEKGIITARKSVIGSIICLESTISTIFGRG